MNKENAQLGFRLWSALLIFGLFGQIAWVIENMYFNVFVYKTITYHPDAIAIMVAASAITATITTLGMGVVSDRLRKRKIFISAGYIIWGLVIGSFAFISKDNISSLFPGMDVVAVTVAVVVIMDCVMTFFGSTANDAAFNAWVTDVTIPENRGRAEGLLNALPLLSMLIVFGVFDPLTRSGKWEEFFIIIGGLVLLGGFSGIFIIRDKLIGLDPKQKKDHYLADVVYGFRLSVIRENKYLYLILVATAVFCTAFQVFMPYLLIYIEFFLGIKNYAVIMAIVLLSSSIASILLGRAVDRYGKSWFLIMGTIVFSLSLLAMYGSGRLWKNDLTLQFALVSIFGTLFMTSYLTVMLILNASMRDFLPEEKRGHYAGVRMIFFVLIPMTIGPFLGSYIIKFSDATFNNQFGEIQHVPNPEIYLGGAVITLLAYPLLRKILQPPQGAH